MSSHGPVSQATYDMSYVSSAAATPARVAASHRRACPQESAELEAPAGTHRGAGRGCAGGASGDAESEAKRREAASDPASRIDGRGLGVPARADCG